MYEAAFEIGSFEHLPAQAQCRLVEALTEALAGVDYAFLLGNLATPLLYDSGVRYAPPPRVARLQPWRDVPRILEVGTGTCMDLAAWRCAELRVRGAQCRPRVTSQFGSGVNMYHVTVTDDAGWNEDPSKLLGMGANEWAYF